MEPESKPCKRCGTPMLWARTPLGKQAPLDLGTAQEGYMIDDEGKARHVTIYKSHFATCPHADEFRKGKA